MDNLENDKRLAEYVNIKLLANQSETSALLGLPEGEHLIYCDNTLRFKLWQPSKDWNQLMEIVEKIEEDGCEVFMNKKTCRIWRETGLYNGHTQIARAEADTKKQAVYQAVSEYVKLLPKGE